MEIGEIVAAIFAMSIFAAIVVTFIFAWKSTHVAWKKLSGANNIGYFGDVDTSRLLESLKNSEQAILLKTCFYDTTFSGFNIMIMPTDTWIDSCGRTVTGLQKDDGIAIGPNFLALTHELGHWCSLQKFGDPDNDHSYWAERGLFEAEKIC
jgi:hypothetical protein